MAFGVPMYFTTKYEHLTIGESKAGDIGKGITITFKDEACRQIP